MNPRVGIVTPTKNRLALLRETMDSVAAQTFTDWELLVVDDGSDDGTAEEVARRAATDPRVRFIRREGEKGGANVCRNIGWRESRADLIVFLDSDDLLEPDCLARRVETMDRNLDLDFVASRTGVFVTRPGDLGRELDAEMVGDDLLRFLYFEAPWQTSAPIWRKAALQTLGGFDEALQSWQDLDLHIRAIAAGLRYIRLPVVDHHMRWQDDAEKVSVRQRRSPAHLNAALATLEKFERHVRDGPGLNWVRQRALCSLYFFVAERWAERGDRREALSAWRRIRDRGLGGGFLHAGGAALLSMKAVGLPVERAINKWKGLMRLRTNSELVAPR